MNETDLKFLEKKGISEQQLEEQLKCFATGFPWLTIEKAAEIGDGIVKAEDKAANGQRQSEASWDAYLKTGKNVVKFVPASGAASRMFKNLFEFLNATYEVPTNDFEKKFFGSIERFAFYDDLNKVCEKNEGKDIKTLISSGEYKKIVDNLLNEKGLNYGNLPKGMLKFHSYNDGNRTPVEEHMVEGALYANVGGVVRLHFTVSAEHQKAFEEKVSEVKGKYEKQFGVKYEISFSVQKPNTDTVAADTNNEPFRDDKGNMVFRPGGHGALIENLNDIDADVVFIKNIDNVVPDNKKDITVEYKKVLAGILVQAQSKSFEYLKILENGSVDEKTLGEIELFSEKTLNNKSAGTLNGKGKEERIAYLKKKLNRPIRVCGMVKNEGEPGGGPYLVQNEDGTVSPQILESSQINTDDSRSMQIMKTATHFNPVDLVCGLKNWKGEKFDLPKYVDKKTGFISSKSKYGRELKALELPGLWNGAMSDWNTLFVEVPVETFNPVKTVNDLLREAHQ